MKFEEEKTEKIQKKKRRERERERERKRESVTEFSLRRYSKSETEVAHVVLCFGERQTEREREREREMEPTSGSAGILYTFMGRGRTVWADHQQSTAVQQPQKTASQMLAKLSQVHAMAIMTES